ncbi:MAG: hypothetical protein IPF92_07500 [Myxococcales bacterium]|nr:hypothetical protein [Myxococcales bacterium]
MAASQGTPHVPAPVLARQGPLAATMAMPASATAALGARSSSLPHAPAQAATQALAVVPPGGVASHASQVSHAPRESEGGQRAAVSVGRASAPAWGPALPPQPFVPAEPAAVVEEPVEVPKVPRGAPRGGRGRRRGPARPRIFLGLPREQAAGPRRARRRVDLRGP